MRFADGSGVVQVRADGEREGDRRVIDKRAAGGREKEELPVLSRAGRDDSCGCDSLSTKAQPIQWATQCSGPALARPVPQHGTVDRGDPPRWICDATADSAAGCHCAAGWPLPTRPACARLDTVLFGETRLRPPTRSAVRREPLPARPAPVLGVPAAEQGCHRNAPRVLPPSHCALGAVLLGRQGGGDVGGELSLGQAPVRAVSCPYARWCLSGHRRPVCSRRHGRDEEHCLRLPAYPHHADVALRL